MYFSSELKESIIFSWFVFRKFHPFCQNSVFYNKWDWNLPYVLFQILHLQAALMSLELISLTSEQRNLSFVSVPRHNIWNSTHNGCRTPWGQVISLSHDIEMHHVTWPHAQSRFIPPDILDYPTDAFSSLLLANANPSFLLSRTSTFRLSASPPPLQSLACPSFSRPSVKPVSFSERGSWRQMEHLPPSALGRA